MSTKILQKYDLYCKEKGFRSSAPRRLVLQIILDHKNTLTAYEVLEKLGKYLKNPKPPTVYRALEFLCAHGFVHRIESLNAYIGCVEDHNHMGSQFLICRICGRVDEIHLCSVPKDFQKQALEKSFQTSHWNVELYGQCSNCG